MNPTSIGAAIACLGIMLGAFGTHTLKGHIGYDLLQIYETGTYYLMLHAFALIFYGTLKTKTMWPAYCFGIGIIIFTGTLYAITFTGIREFGMVTPVGGVFFIVGWVGFVLQARTKKLIS